MIKINYKCGDCRKKIKHKLIEDIQKIIMDFETIFNEDAVKLCKRIDRLKEK